MRTRSRSTAAIAAGLGLLAALALAGVAQAAETTLTAQLAGVTEGENPGDPDGSGSATIVIDPEEGTACWDLSVENISPVTQSHIHVGGEGEAGDVVVPLDVDGFEGTSEGCIEPMEDASVLQAILDDPAGYYVNVHTDDFQAGAVRGQLTAAATPPNTAMSAERGIGLQAAIGLVLLLAALGLGLRTARVAIARD